MSYDLMVFDVAAAPAGREAFMAWYRQQSEWSEEHDYDDPAVSTPALRAWFMELIERFPAMNGPLAPKDEPEDDALLTDYSVGKSVIYAAFAWSKSEAAREAVFSLAAKHGLGFFDASSNHAGVWLPKNGELVLTHSAAV
jgi:hypothetical protein